MQKNCHAIDLQMEFTTGAAAFLIRKKAKRLVKQAHWSRADQEDIEQELRVVVFTTCHRFDPEKGDWPVFVSTLIERAAAKLYRAHRVQKRKPRQAP